MAKMIYRTEKVNTAGEVSGREREANRTEKDIGRFQNSDIDWELTNENYSFKTTNNWVEAVKTKCEELGCSIKKDSVLVLDHLITASPEWMEQQTEETKMKFFEDSVKWIVDEFCGGDDSLLLNARIHKDESNWHLYAATIPIVKNAQRSEEELAKLKRKPRQKEYSLNAKKIMGGRGQYSARQQSIEDKIGKKYGLEEREVREQGQAKKHKTVQQAKLDAVREEVREAEQQKEQLEKEIKKHEKHLQEVQEIDKKNTQVCRDRVGEYKQQIASAKEEAMKERSSLSASIRKKEEIEAEYRDLVIKHNDLAAKVNRLREENEQREQYNDGLIAEEKDLRNKIDNLEKVPAIEAQKNKNKINALDRICIGVSESGEYYFLGEVIDKARKHSANMDEFLQKMETVMLSLNKEPIHNLWEYIQDKGISQTFNRDDRDEV